MTRDITSVCVGGSILGQYAHGEVFPPQAGDAYSVCLTLL